MDDFGSWVLAGLYEFMTFVVEIKTAILEISVKILEKGIDCLVWILEVRGTISDKTTDVLVRIVRTIARWRRRG